jgi:tetratricopeptide (TPR) repeat protein
MSRPGLPVVICVLLATFFFAAAPLLADEIPLVKRPWFEAHSPHFTIYSCGEPARVFQVAGQLEQFCGAYALLAGAQALVSPPIVVIVFPDEESMRPFVPLYQGQPASLSGFFVHGEDENLIVLSLPRADTEALDMSVVFHEYTHLLLRRNDRVWPLWLKEGMAEIYSTFQTTGYTALIAQPIPRHLSVLAGEPLMPLAELFSVSHDSPQYNEQSRQGIFYAESWLLTHLLFAGDNAVLRQRFGNYTPLLRAGENPVQAFTNALGLSLPQMEAQLQNYLAGGQFAPIQLTLPNRAGLPPGLMTRPLTPVENYFRLGDELMRINRPDEAEKYFTDGQNLAPASPLPYEGLGLLAISRDQPDEALNDFTESLKHGSASYLTHYYYALKKYQLAETAAGAQAPLPPETTAEIHDEVLKSIVKMPNFGASHELFGVLEMAPEGDHQLGEQHLQLAVQVEPENLYFQLTLAQAQIANKEPDAARKTLSTLLLPGVEAKLRQQADALAQQIGN